MQVKANGNRNLSFDFETPKKFKLLQNGVEIPYIRTGKNSVRISKNVDGILDLEEIQEAPKPIVKPIKLQPQQMALVNPNDVISINQAAQQLEIEQNILSENQKRLEYAQNYIDIQQQKIMESVESVGMLETDNKNRLDKAESSIFNLAGEIAKTGEQAVSAIISVDEKLNQHENAENPHKITKKTINLDKVDNTSDLDKPVSKFVQAELDKKADKEELESIKEEISTYQEKTEKFNNALSNYTGGIGGTELPSGGLTGQLLAKKTDYTGDYEWVSPELDVGDGVLTLQKNGTDIDTFSANAKTDKTINITVPTQASDINALPDSIKYGSSLALSIDSSTYIVTAQLKDQDGNNLGNSQTIDLPLESVVVNGSYDSENKKIILTLENGNTIEIPVGDLISGLQTEITSDNKLDADLVDDSTSTNKFVTSNEKNTWNGKQDTLTSENAGTDIEITDTPDVEITETVTGDNTLTLESAKADSVTSVILDGGTEQSGTPTPDTPVDIVCNNGVIKVNSQGQIYTDGTVETVEVDTTGDTATAEMLLSVGNYKDVQNITSGNVTRNVGIKVFDGTEDWNVQSSSSSSSSLYFLVWEGMEQNKNIVPFCTHFVGVSTSTSITSIKYPVIRCGWHDTSSPSRNRIFIKDANYTSLANFKQFLVNQYANGTPVIVVYPLATPTTESVTGQSLTIQQGTNTLTITQASIDTLRLTAEYTKIIQGEGLKISFTNDSGYITGITSSDVVTALGYTPYNSANPAGYTSNVGTVTSVNSTSPDANGNVSISIPSEVTESTVSGWGFTKNTGTVTSVNSVSPVNGNVTLSIPTVNNATLTITQGGTIKGTFTANASSNVTIDLDSGGGAGAIDNLSITKNASQELQTMGIIDSNNTTNAIKTWTGTKAQYEAIVTKDANTEYLCTDTGEMYLGTVKICGADLNAKQDVSNLVTSVSSSSTDAQYPSAKLFYDTCGDIETLINAL